MVDIKIVDIYECQTLVNCRRHLTAFFITFYLTKLIFIFVTRLKYAQYFSSGMYVACSKASIMEQSINKSKWHTWLANSLKIFLIWIIFQTKNPFFLVHVLWFFVVITRISLQNILSGLIQQISLNSLGKSCHMAHFYKKGLLTRGNFIKNNIF